MATTRLLRTEQILRLCRSGLSYAEVARRLQVTRSYVSLVVKEAGGRGALRLPGTRREHALNLLRSGVPVANIKNVTGYSLSYLTELQQSLGLYFCRCGKPRQKGRHFCDACTHKRMANVISAPHAVGGRGSQA